MNKRGNTLVAVGLSAGLVLGAGACSAFDIRPTPQTVEAPQGGVTHGENGETNSLGLRAEYSMFNGGDADTELPFVYKDGKATVEYSMEDGPARLRKFLFTCNKAGALVVTDNEHIIQPKEIARLKDDPACDDRKLTADDMLAARGIF